MFVGGFENIAVTQGKKIKMPYALPLSIGLVGAQSGIGAGIYARARFEKKD